MDNGPGVSFTFWIAPVTLVFKNPTYMKVNAELDFINGLEIADIFKEADEAGNLTWRIALQQGNILIKAQSYIQIVRRPPSLQYHLAIPNNERGEISFGVISDRTYLPEPDVEASKNQQQFLIKMNRDKYILKQEEECLDQAILGTKAFLLEKQRIKQKLLKIDKLIDKIN
jgi:hypothetical protein